MGRRANSKKEQRKRRQKQKQKQKDDPFYEIRKLIGTVSDDDALCYHCDVPSDESMDEIPFPNVEVVAPEHEWLTNNLIAGVDEWGMAWYRVLREDGLVDPSNNDYDKYYSRFSEQEKQTYRERMVDIVRRERRSKMYCKWMIAKKRLEWEKVCKGKKKVGREEDKGGPKAMSSLEWNTSWGDWDDDDVM
ncbi:uncharacterized protein LOC110723576 [Chenopodium quinoa]|uniref:uncharacterized protein LOC110723576 n=1 Tax=Chenopodium quinoa TaxID=63459 RepID=UPI000B77EBA9|nr:uncharacterized protein LOC110723576 [Chenopodium quinoa]